MSLHVIIDGYNLIRRSAHLALIDQTALELGRDALVDKLAAYRKFKRHKVTVVFDGSQKYYLPGPAFSEKGISLRFSRPGETADDMIKKMAKKERQRAVVISSDRDVCREAGLFGAATMGSEEFEEKLEMTLVMGKFGGNSGDNSLEENGWAGTTVKKGPSRRPPKRMRQNRKKTEKL